MTRVKRGYIARRRRTKIRVFVSTFQGAHSRLTRTIAQQKIRALVSTHRDRDRKKRDFRRLWITRINGLIREREVCYNYNTLINNYSKLIHNLHKRQLLFNRKILAHLARFDEYPLIFIFNECEIVKKEDWKESLEIF
uniref:50S ribosomal protein L20 n=1 Tax=Mirabilis jalapa TaxID=3538 RepID=A0A411JT40_MIRJA|nr:ribosomal protein L20 [Mirabilis jalapa]QBC68233.1 ribosomal protein L20 [Mirabilis jalapa]QVL29746.1 ribosomal protein L20 [Mirabilis jalapa]